MIQFGNKEAASIYIGGKEVQKIEIGGKTAYEKVSVDYFYIENEYAGQNTLTLTTTISGSPSSSLYSDTVEYSKDKTNWTTITFDIQTPYTITMDQGEKVYFRNDNGKFNYEYSSDYFRTTFSASQNHSVGGNIMSLIDYTNIQSAVLTTIGVFNCLFLRDSTLTDCSNLELPATTLTERCYKAMFQEATSLATTITTLPATTLTAQCYMSMYWGTAVTTTNTLPATTLAADCYRNMYRGSHITTAPNLPATTLATGCYYSMLQDCTSLTTASPLPATTMETDCYRGMYRGCTALRTAPVLYGTTLASNCYNAIFYGCSNLNSVTTYANGSDYANATTNWLYYASLIGTVYNNGTRTYTTNSYNGIPTGWTEDTSNRFVFSNTVITNVGNNQAQLTSDIQVNYTGTWDDAYFEVYNELDKNRSIHFSPSDITNGVLTAPNLITESNVATLISPATVTIYNSGTAVWTGSVSFTVVQ